MPNHVKPTQEELEANIAKVAEELEAEKPEEKEVIEEEKEPEVEEVVVEEKKEEEPKEDYKKKFIESTKEAQILHAKNKKVNEALEKAMAFDDVSEEEIKTEYSEWEEMSDLEQKMAKDNLLNKKRISALSEITKDTKDFESWQDKVNKYIEDPKTLVDIPKLDGRQEEFRLFATKPTRRGVDFEDLVSAFLFTTEKEAKPKSKGKMFETGTGGPDNKGKPKDGKLSVEEGRKLREVDYKKYVEYTKQGKIKIEDL